MKDWNTEDIITCNCEGCKKEKGERMKKISLQEIYNKYLGKVNFTDTCTIFFYTENDVTNAEPEVE